MLSVAAFAGAFPGPARPARAGRRRTCTVRCLEVVPDGGVTTPAGFRAEGIKAGLKPSGAADLAVIVADEMCAAAGVFTTSVVCAPPVDVCKEKLLASGGRARAIVINSGQANAATGTQGRQNALETAEVAAEELGVDTDAVLVASTGVIGQQMDMDKLRAGVVRALKSVTADGGERAAKAIMTTDLVDKRVAYTAQLSSGTVSVGGMSKGSGMIHPNMATMLGFVTADVAIEPEVWKSIIQTATRKSFNQITVDGDTSTNDCLIGLASGASGAKAESPEDVAVVSEAVTACCRHLAKAIARDGEGATVLLEVDVSGAASDEDAELVARTVAGSSLVKSAVFGRDPNWGRIAAAAGRAGVAFDQNDLDIWLGPYQMMASGQPLQFDRQSASDYMVEASKAAYFSGGDTVRLRVSIGDAHGKGAAWGCDLSYDYVKINAEYTT